MIVPGTDANPALRSAAGYWPSGVLGWQAGDRLTLTAAAGMVIARGVSGPVE